jgi:hypothetical protein
MFSQSDEGNISAFKVYKDPIEDEIDARKPTAIRMSCNAAPLADASNIIKQTRLIIEKGDAMKKQSLPESNYNLDKDSEAIQMGIVPADNCTPEEPTGSVTNTQTESESAEIRHAQNVQDVSDAEKGIDNAIVSDITESSPLFTSPADTQAASPSHAERIHTTDPLDKAGGNDSDTPHKSEISVSQDSQDFGDDIEFDSQMLQKIHEIENKMTNKLVSDKPLTSTEPSVKESEEAEEDFGPDIDPDILDCIESKPITTDSTSVLISPATPVESYEEIKSWLEDYDGMEDMFDVDLDGQLLDSQTPTTTHSSSPQSPTKSCLEPLLRSSELDTQKILSEVKSITSKYGGFTTGSKKPLATAISSEAVSNLFEQKASSKKNTVNKKQPIRRLNRSTTPNARPRFGGFVNARTSSPLRASETAKRKAAKAFGQDGELLYQINDTDVNTSSSNEDTSPQSVKSQKLANASR